MPNADPKTRSPASHTRSLTEGGTSGTLLIFLISQYAPDLPLEIQLAIAAYGVQLIGNVMSILRNRGWGGVVTGA